jgi:hypothetical protein
MIQEREWGGRKLAVMREPLRVKEPIVFAHGPDEFLTLEIGTPFEPRR